MNIQGTNKKIKSELSEELASLEALEESQLLSLTQWQRKADITFEILKLLEQEESYWYSRSHEQWLLQGDQIPSFSIE